MLTADYKQKCVYLLAFKEEENKFFFVIRIIQINSWSPSTLDKYEATL